MRPNLVMVGVKVGVVLGVLTVGLLLGLSNGPGAGGLYDVEPNQLKNAPSRGTPMGGA